jgi:hypothetical protein
VRAIFAIALWVVLSAPAILHAQTKPAFSTLYTFSSVADGNAGSPLVADAAGNLYGTTYAGGTNPNCTSCGTVFKLTPPSTGEGAWTKTILHSFAGGTDGLGPSNLSKLAIDPAGNLYGTTLYGGGNTTCSTYGCGTVFELSQNPANGVWTEHVLYRFTGGTDGGYVGTPVVLDNFGNLFGVSTWYGNTSTPACVQTLAGDPPGCGNVFELSPPAVGQTSWKLAVLHVFGNTPDGASPLAGLAIDDFGNLFGTTTNGGAPSTVGTVFRLQPPQPGGTAWTETILFDFAANDNVSGGFFPADTLIFGPGGLYGTLKAGGHACTGVDYGCGVVFSLSQPPTPGGRWNEHVLHYFSGGEDGAFPVASLHFDRAGNLFGATYTGGAGPCTLTSYPAGCGLVYELTPQKNGLTWTETALHRFQNGNDGAYPLAGLTLDGQGNLAGTTYPSSTSGERNVHRGVVYGVFP